MESGRPREAQETSPQRWSASAPPPTFRNGVPDPDPQDEQVPTRHRSQKFPDRSAAAKSHFRSTLPEKPPKQCGHTFWKGFPGTRFSCDFQPNSTRKKPLGRRGPTPQLDLQKQPVRKTNSKAMSWQKKSKTAGGGSQGGGWRCKAGGTTAPNPANALLATYESHIKFRAA